MKNSILSSQTTTEEKISADELIKLIPEELISKLAASLEVDKWVKKLKGDALFKLIMFSLLSSERLSLRIMEDNFRDPMFRALAPAVQIEKVAWTGIRDRLLHINSEFFQKIYEKVLSTIFEKYSKNSLTKYHIRRYDSTMIRVFSHLLIGMRVGNTSLGKTQVKVTTEFTDDFLIKFEYHQKQALLSEETALKRAVNKSIPYPTQEKQEVHVFDQGLKSRDSFDEFDNDQTLFITVATNKIRYQIVRPLTTPSKGIEDFDNNEIEFISESIVRLYKSGHELSKQEFRLVEFSLKKKNDKIHKLFFITNVLDLEPSEIAYIYKKRWEIEVLFRFLKQEMNLTHFICNDKKAIKIMIYCTLIAAMLILIYKKQNGIVSYKLAKIRFFKELMYSIQLDILEDAERTVEYKKTIKNLLKKE